MNDDHNMRLCLSTKCLVVLFAAATWLNVPSAIAGCNAPDGTQYTLGLTVDGPAIVCVGENVTFTATVTGYSGASWPAAVTWSGDVTGSGSVSASDGTVVSTATSFTSPSSALDDQEAIATATIAADDNNGLCEATVTKKFTILKVESIDGYVYGESGRKIEHMEALPDPANVVASGYMKFKATILPSSISDTLCYKWTATAGTLTNPEGTGNTYLEVKWDAPDGHEQDVTLTLEVKASASGSTICTETVDLKTIRPYVVRVKFVDDFWNEEQQIYDGGDPEFDAVDVENYPVCYVMHRGMQTQLDIAGEKDDYKVNNLTKKTPVRVSASASYGGSANQFDEDSMDDDTEDWSAEDYSTVEIESDDNVPEKVTKYDDFEMHWTFKVKDSSENWITAYEEESGYSQKTTHGNLYTIYDVYECGEANFTESHMDDAVGWATDRKEKGSHLKSQTMTLTGAFSGHYSRKLKKKMASSL